MQNIKDIVEEESQKIKTEGYDDSVFLNQQS